LAKQLHLDVAQLTDVGRKREHNEDNMAYVIPKDPQVMANKGALFIVADGMGGHAAGEVASEIAVDTVSNMYYQDDSDDVAVSLLHAIKRANASIHQRAAENMLRTGMGTTCVTAVLRGNMAYIANVGDSRAYLLRGSQVKQISQDHSWVAEQVRAGLLTDDQARTHAQRNVITRSLGTQAEVDVDVFHEELSEGDSLMLCTDGLSAMVSEEELQRIIQQFVPQESVYHLVERANENGGPDNITAIVVRVNEVSEEPPGVRHPVRVGGREVGEEDTAILGMLPNGHSAISGSNGEGRIPSAPLRLSSGPLSSTPDSDTAPQPALGKPQRSRSRLLYPTLALIVLLIITGIGGGVYYFLRSNESQTVNQALDNAQRLIQSSVTTDPTSALKTLSTAQSNLRDVQKNHQLDETQIERMTQLQDKLVVQVKAAISTYNQKAKIFVLPCSDTSTHSINNTSTQTNSQSIAWAQDPAKNLVRYTLAQDGVLYRVNSQYGLVSSLSPLAPAKTPPHFLSLASNGSLLYLLEKQTSGNLYTLMVFQPGPMGILGAPTSTAQIGANFTDGGYMPTLMTAWGNTVYVVLSSQSVTNAGVLSYVLDANGRLRAPRETNFSISAPIVSIAAFPTQLFMLLSSGEVRSLPLESGSQHLLPTPVLVQAPIALPLTTSGKGFKAYIDVPVVTPVEEKGSTPLMVPSALPTNPAMLAAGLVNGVPHLYIGDPINHRVLDLEVAEPSVQGTSTPTPTPVGSTLTLQLVQQYVSPADLSMVKSLAVDPQGVQLGILSQNTSSMVSLVTASTGPQTGCAA
jgi:serine/threonine protein phosphatase PrpC/Flp pilus assembly protein TadG